MAVRHHQWYILTIMLRCRLSLNQSPHVAWLAEGVQRAGVREYHLPEWWQLHWYDYPLDMWMNEQHIHLPRGAVTLQPPDTVARYRCRATVRHLCAHFQLPMVRDQPSHTLPCYLEPRQVRAAYRQLLERAVREWTTRPARSVAALWELLWLLTEDFGEPAESGPADHPAVIKASQYIERRLAQPLTPRDIAARSGISHNHLIRLFHAAFGQTVTAYVRQRRVDKARHLLVASTQPIKVVAAECGVPDLQAFNKLIRRTLGVSPSSLRRRPIAPRPAW